MLFDVVSRLPAGLYQRFLVAMTKRDRAKRGGALADQLGDGGRRVGARHERLTDEHGVVARSLEPTCVVATTHARLRRP